uniref:nucleoside-diphosphate kinase n=1 Tax=Monodon monoceros TaxID=40151 RepID=A0A8C6BFR2_MONMO
MPPLMGCTRLWRLVCSLPVLGHTCLCVPAQKGPPGPGAILVKVKPDGLQQWLLGIVIQGFESRVLGLVGTKTLQAPDSILAEAYHYQEEALLPSPHQLHELWPLVPMVWQDPHVVYTTRAMIGNSNSAEGDLSLHIRRQPVPCVGAQREIHLWFRSRELVDWAKEGNHSNIYSAQTLRLL